MAGISSKAAGESENKNKYNGKELESEEFNDGNGLEEYDYGARFYTAQIGRWQVNDALSEKHLNLSPYSFVANNPILFVDNDGKDFGIYVDHVNHTITVSATYYASNYNSSSNFSADRAKSAAASINSSSGKYSLNIQNGQSYKINFDLKVVDETSVRETEKYNTNNDQMANSFSEVSVLGMVSNFGDAGGYADDGKDIYVLGGDELQQLGISMLSNDRHEMLHTLGDAHEAIGNNAITENDAMVTKSAIQGIFTQASLRDKNNKIDAGGSNKNALAGHKNGKKYANAKITTNDNKPVKLKGLIIENEK